MVVGHAAGRQCRAELAGHADADVYTRHELYRELPTHRPVWHVHQWLQATA